MAKFYTNNKDNLILGKTKIIDILHQDLPEGYAEYMKSESGINDNLRKEFDRTVDLLKSIKLNGYRPSFFEYEFPQVVILINASGGFRFVNMNGAHRLAILSALGHERVLVALEPHRYPPIMEKDVDKWLYVHSGLISRTDALKLFQLYFTINGSERLNHVLCYNTIPFFLKSTLA